jgi:hypothetical protein
LDELVKTIDYAHNKKGIGLFVSQNIKKLITFPFEVKEKVIIRHSFEIRDLLYFNHYSRNYFLLALTEKSAKLFSGTTDQISEVKDENFPRDYEELYEYAKPARGSSYVGNAYLQDFEKDKSVMEAIRMKNFFEESDECLKKYLLPNTPLLLAGTEKDVSLFRNTTAHKKNIIDTLSGNFSYVNEAELGLMAWLKVWAFIDKEKTELISLYGERKGAGLGVEGINEVWTAAKAGRGLKLLVEKDFYLTGFVTSEDNKLHIKLPKRKHSTIPDIIDDIIETVLNKNGDVIVVENEALRDHQRIALITRY